MPPMQQHTYEELRDIVVDVLLGIVKVANPVQQWAGLTAAVAEVLTQRESTNAARGGILTQPQLHGADRELIRDIFWDLFRQGFVTLGLDDMNPNWPFFRLSHFGQQTLATNSPYRFHDTTTFLALVRREVPDISPEAIAYLDEAVASFYAGCLLASCIMLGVAAEAEFLRLADAAANSAKHAKAFAAVEKTIFVRQTIAAFQAALKPLVSTLPRGAVEDLDTNFNAIQSVLRIARNEAGHPTATPPPAREQVYVFLQLFVPFARQLMRLRQALS